MIMSNSEMLTNLEKLIDNLPEVYQSIYLHGKLIREGVRANDFERLEVIKNYIKPRQTILDIGSNVGFFTIHLAKLFPENVFVSIEREYSYVRLQQELIKLEGVNNVILIHSQLTTEWLYKATQACVYFDVTLLLSVLHHIPDAEIFLTQLNEISKSFIIELPHPDESRVCGKDVLKKQLTLEKISQVKPVFLKMPYEATTHCDADLKRSFYYADSPNYQRESIFPYIEYPLQPRNYILKATEEGLIIHKTHLNHSIQTIPGVLIFDFAQLGQILMPSYETCINQIEDEFYRLEKIDNVADIRPWNILFTKNGLRFIDYQYTQDLHGNLKFNKNRDLDLIKNYLNLIFRVRIRPQIIVDAVFFQINQSGIARVWKSLLEEWVNNGFADHIVVLDRAGTAPKIPGIRYRTIASYDYNNTGADREMLQQVCDEEGAEVFISSYYTTPTTTPSVFIAYDMIPEVMGWDMSSPMWQEKHQGIQHASQYIAISEHTARDLVTCFPEIPIQSVSVAHCGVESTFSPATPEQINSFKFKYGITKPYFILVGVDTNYKNSILFFQAFEQLTSSSGFDIVCTGNRGTLAAKFRNYTLGSTVHILELNDDELATAYSGAVALVYPSIYEGFGLPIVEAMGCGCPVITCPNASIPEAAGEAAIYVNDNDVDGLANALLDVQKPGIRKLLIAAGLEQAQKFSWDRMANAVSASLIQASILYLNLREINLIIFPNWSQSEELISFDLERIIKILATHSDSHKITLLIDTTDISNDDAAMFVSNVTMNLLMQEDLDFNEELEISLLGNIADNQWVSLLPRINARIVLEHENKQAIANWQQIFNKIDTFNGLVQQLEIQEFIDNYDLSCNLYSFVEKFQQKELQLSISTKKLLFLRKQIAKSCLDKEEKLLGRLYLSKFGEVYQALLNSGIQYESITEDEHDFVTNVLTKLVKTFNEQNAIQYLLVAMLYCRPHQLPLTYDLTQIPSWLINDYLEFSFKPPLYFQEIGEPDTYFQYIENWINYLHKNILEHSESQWWQDIAGYFTYTANFISLYFNKENLQNIYTKRADIMKLYLQQFNESFEYDFSERLTERTRIRVGILASHFAPQTETFATLSIYKHLNRDLFEVILFTLNTSNHRLERYCAGHADALIELPKNLVSQVQTIREADLDILFISTNITAVTHQITLLSLYRLARIQVVDANSPVTTGMPHIDYYISSKISEIEENAQQHYTEKLITLDSPPQCFDFATEEKILPTISISRESLGITTNAVVYISGANYYKIIPEQEETWAKIIASVPNSVLLLYPFNPNWSSSYPCIAFRKRIVNTFAKYGLTEDRLIIFEPAPNRTDVKERLKLGDIYLDSYPYSGMTSLIDPLEVGLPTVVMEAEPSRSRKGASLLRELEIFDLITNNEEAYIKVAVTLGNNRELCKQKSLQIQEKMQANPCFLDSRYFSAKIGDLFEQLFTDYLGDSLGKNLSLRDINLIIFPDWQQSEDLIGFELERVIKGLATYPESHKTTLLIAVNNISLEDAEIFLSSVVMNILMNEDTDVTEKLEISLVESLMDIQWQALLRRLKGRIILEHEDQQALEIIKVEKILSEDLNAFVTSERLLIK